MHYESIGLHALLVDEGLQLLNSECPFTEMHKNSSNLPVTCLSPRHDISPNAIYLSRQIIIISIGLVLMRASHDWRRARPCRRRLGRLRGAGPESPDRCSSSTVIGTVVALAADMR